MKSFETIGGRIIIFLSLCIIIGLTSYFYFMNNSEDVSAVTKGNAVFKTSEGEFEIEFFGEKSPKTVENFKKLVKEGFYDGVKFHRVGKGFMIQGGDPLTKDDSQQAMWGTGGPGYMFEDEISELNNNLKGTISMANAGPNTNGSQFFINTVDNSNLDDRHTVFGKVVRGMDVVEKIENVEVGIKKVPVEAVVIESVVLN